MMSKLQAITPPIWIFVFTLFLVIVTGSMMGGDACDSAAVDCDTVSAEASAAGTACSDEACSGGRTPLLPLSIIALGFVVYFVWLRQGGLDRDTLFTGESRDTSRASGNDATVSGAAVKNTTPAARAAAASPAAPTRAKPATKSPTPAEAAAPARASKADEVAAEKPAAASTSASVPSEAPTTGPASKAARGAGSSLSPAQRKLYVGLLSAGTGESKDALAEGLARLIGSTEAKSWKDAPAGDLELLTKSLSLGALLSPAGTAYAMSSGSAADAAHAALAEKTKKALHEHCVETIRRDMQDLTKDVTYPEGVTSDMVKTITAALEAPDALSGIARCSKGALVELAAFLEPAGRAS